MERKCKNCESKLLGRVDQKFCSAQCRSDFNNRLNGKDNNLIRRIDGILRKNKRIMESLNPDGRMKIHRSKLIEMGFDFNYFTNTYKTKNGTTFYFCYDLGYQYLCEDFYFIIERQEYLNHN